jgi:hypothetical protein
MAPLFVDGVDSSHLGQPMSKSRASQARHALGACQSRIHTSPTRRPADSFTLASQATFDR